MYTPKNMQMLDVDQQLEFIHSYGFAILVSEDLQISHLPLIIESSESGVAHIYGHMAKANTQWKALDGTKVKAIFSGPHSYISPTWYAGSPAVPTWNYAAVHVTGIASLLDSAQTLVAVHKLVKQYESTLLNDNNLMPEDYQRKLAQAIVGFKIEVTHMEGKQKLGQHRSVGDQQGVAAGLANDPHLDASALLAYMRKTGTGLG